MVEETNTNEPKETCEQKHRQVTKYVDEKHCEDIITTSCKPVTMTSCNDYVEKVPRQEANKVCVNKPSRENIVTTNAGVDMGTRKEGIKGVNNVEWSTEMIDHTNRDAEKGTAQEDQECCGTSEQSVPSCQPTIMWRPSGAPRSL